MFMNKDMLRIIIGELADKYCVKRRKATLRQKVIFEVGRNLLDKLISVMFLKQQSFNVKPCAVHKHNKYGEEDN